MGLGGGLTGSGASDEGSFHRGAFGGVWATTSYYGSPTGGGLLPPVPGASPALGSLSMPNLDMGGMGGLGGGGGGGGGAGGGGRRRYRMPTVDDVLLELNESGLGSTLFEGGAGGPPPIDQIVEAQMKIRNAKHSKNIRIPLHGQVGASFAAVAEEEEDDDDDEGTSRPTTAGTEWDNRAPPSRNTVRERKGVAAGGKGGQPARPALKGGKAAAAKKS